MFSSCRINNPAVGLAIAFIAVMSLTGVLSAGLDGETAYGKDDQLPNAKAITSGPGNHLRPIWAPDGSRIVFQLNEPGGNYAIWLMNPDGSGLRRVTDGAGDDRRPTFSPDGTHIAFDSQLDGSRAIWTVGLDGSDLRKVTDGTGEESFASWSPDGKSIAFFEYADGAMDIEVRDLVNAKTSRITRGLANIDQQNCTFGCHAVAWNKDGSKIAFTSGDQQSVMVANPDGSNQISMTAGKRPGKYHFPVWTMDGGLLFSSDEFGEKPYTDIWMLSSNGKDLERVFTRVDHGGPFAWSPDGKKVAYHSPRTGEFQIYVADLTTSLGTMSDFRNLPPVTLPDRTRPAFLTGAIAGAAAGVVGLFGLAGALFIIRRRDRGG
jgi:Tol biopolymer transport system component